jgi:hypothetical protein
MIKRVHNQYVLFTKDGKKVLGKHPSMEKAKAQEVAINISKARAAGHHIPKQKE